VPVGATTGPVAVTNSAGTGTSAANFTVSASTVTPNNPTPTADLTAALAISLATLTLGASVSFNVTAAKGTAPYAYEVVATDTATGQQFTLGTTKTVNWTPTAVGSYAIEATVTDSSSPAQMAQSAIRYLQVVAAANRIPVADAGQDVTLPAGTTSLALMGTASDPDTADTLTYAWRQITGPNSATGMPAATLNVVASGLVAGTYQFGFRSTDNHGAQSSEDFVLVTVNAAALPVLIVAFSDSITYGYNLANPETQAWIKQLAGVAPGGIEFWKRGYPGDRTTDALGTGTDQNRPGVHTLADLIEELQLVKANYSQIIIIEAFGINDAAQISGITGATIYSRKINIANQLKAVSPNVKVIGTTITGFDTTSYGGFPNFNTVKHDLQSAMLASTGVYAGVIAVLGLMNRSHCTLRTISETATTYTKTYAGTLLWPTWRGPSLTQ
jgi:lysophospholipase L1-like esterase